MINKFIVITTNDEKKIFKFNNSESCVNRHMDCFSKVLPCNTKHIFQRFYNSFEKKVYYKKMYDGEIAKNINSVVEITFNDNTKQTGFLKKDKYTHKLFLSKNKYTRGNVIINIEFVKSVVKL